MNIMLANVRSRIREIGIRKALGATYREIKLQFLTEAVLISLAGGLVGSLSWVRLAAFHPLLFRLRLSHLVAVRADRALIVATLVGVIFGTAPATRAAQMDPVDALKYE